METRIGLRFHEARTDPRYGVELAARTAARQGRVAESLGEVTSAGFTVWDLRSYWRAREGVLLTAGIENLFDKNYREHLDLLTGFTPGAVKTGLGVFQPGFNAYVGLELRY
jgi:iron complex outermembrane receptor protein